MQNCGEHCRFLSLELRNRLCLYVIQARAQPFPAPAALLGEPQLCSRWAAGWCWGEESTGNTHKKLGLSQDAVTNCSPKFQVRSAYTRSVLQGYPGPSRCHCTGRALCRGPAQGHSSLPSNAVSHSAIIWCILHQESSDTENKDMKVLWQCQKQKVRKNISSPLTP